MSEFYLELDSTYRDRTQYPLASHFEVLSSESGNKTAATALDPISNATPQVIFSSFNSLAGSVVSYAGFLGPAGSIFTLTTISNASKVKDYYSGVVVSIVSGGNTEYKRISSWTYLETAGGLDYFYVEFTDGSLVMDATFTLSDPSDDSDPNHITLFVPRSYPITNYYTTYFLFNQTLNEWLTITAFNAETHLITASPDSSSRYTSGTWLLNQVFIIRMDIPVQYGNAIVGLSTNTATLVPIQNYNLVGSFIRLTANDEIRRIVSFNSNTNVATVHPPFSIVPVGNYEILQYTRDNVNNVVFNFAKLDVPYEVSLLNIVVPNLSIKSSYGGRAIYYPYLYVELSTSRGSDGKGPNMIASNNPNSTRMLFRVIVNDTSTAVISPVIRLDGDGMVQKMRVSPKESFKMSVYLPDGTLFVPETADNDPPLSPNPLLQISAIFHFKYTHNNKC